jgi:hypothetical protein
MVLAAHWVRTRARRQGPARVDPSGLDRSAATRQSHAPRKKKKRWALHQPEIWGVWQSVRVCQTISMVSNCGNSQAVSAIVRMAEHTAGIKAAELVLAVAIHLHPTRTAPTSVLLLPLSSPPH